jgi:hypothetical protein
VSDPRYTLRMAMHARLSRGGYLYTYEVLYEGAVVGSVTATRKTRQSPEVKVYALGEREFATAEELRAAHQHQLTDPHAEGHCGQVVGCLPCGCPADSGCVGWH